MISGSAEDNSGGFPCFNGFESDWLSSLLFFLNIIPSAYIASNAIYNYNNLIGKGYCAITIPDYTCEQLNFENISWALDKNGNAITSTSGSTIIQSVTQGITFTCGSNSDKSYLYLHS